MEIFAKPAVGAIIEKSEDGCNYVLVQERQKENGGTENGFLEIPAGKIREYESIFSALRREVWEETGLTVTEIIGEKDTIVSNVKDYKVISFTPFCSTQNLSGGYSLVLQTFVCHAEGTLRAMTNETANIRWVSQEACLQTLTNDINSFYPLHINALKKFLAKSSP